MSTRLIAVALLVALVAFIGVLAAVGLFVRDPLPILSPRVPIEVGPDDAGLSARLTMDGSYRFQAVIAGAAPETPTVALRPIGSGGAPVVATVSPLEGGQHLATGQFTAPGRWELSIATPDRSASFGFVLRE